MLTKNMRTPLLALCLLTATAAAQTVGEAASIDVAAGAPSSEATAAGDAATAAQEASASGGEATGAAPTDAESAEEASAGEESSGAAVDEDQAPKDAPIRESLERHLPGDETFRTLARDPNVATDLRGDRVEKQQVDGEVIDTVKLTGIIKPLYFDSGAIRIRDEDIAKIRRALESVQGKANVRLHLAGHADNQRLSPDLAARYGDNQGLSRERAGEVAELLQRALTLPPEAIAFEGYGDTRPVASNGSDAGRARNRRVEVEVWYDEPKVATTEKDVVVTEEFRQIKVCRVQELCLMRFQEGNARRTRVNNLVTALHYGEEGVEVTPEFVEQVRKAFANLQGKQNVTAKFIGYSDDIALSDRNARIYGDAVALSKARAHRTALAVQEALGLPAASVQSDGRGATTFIGANDTAQGRALNRRVEVQFWYDDPMQELPEGPQMCPAEADHEIVTRIHQPSGGELPVLTLDGSDIVIPVGMTERLRSALDEIRDRDNARLRFIGYTGNARLDRRTTSVYEDDIGLSTARARRAMDTVRSLMQLGPEQVEHEGHGFVQAADVPSEGFVQGPDSYIEVQVVYDEEVLRDDYEGVDITRLNRELAPANAYGLNPMHISVNGKPLDDPGRSSADVQRCTDVALDDAGIRFQFDDLKASPRLAVSASPQVATVDEPVRFRMYSNYNGFIGRAEVRVLDKTQSTQATPIAVVTLDANGNGEWQPAIVDIPASGRELQYVLRAYDEQGRFDETSPRPLWLVKANADGSVADVPAIASTAGAPPLAGYGESHIARRNIRIGANTVAVRGSGIPQGHTVWVAGRAVPVDANGDFIAEEILPDGLQTVEVAVLDPQGNGQVYLRDLEMRSRDRFLVGIADVTLASNNTKGPADLLEGENTAFERSSSFYGRLAFFGTEKFGNGWRLTASADTREGPIKDIFGNLLDKAPDALFRRLDPDYHYPTFGDDGVVEEMAPTMGKFYLRAEHGDDFAMWGNFQTDYASNEMAQVDRGLYGANAEWKSDTTTTFGERRTVVSGFAAEPGTIGGRDEFRGTGGSLFYLRNQDILGGSERLRIEMRDKDSQLVTGTVDLRPGLDYDIDYLQGRVLLSQPLSSTGGDNMLVRDGGLSGDEAWLVARYEYAPGFDEIDTLSTGGRAHMWLNDHVGLGLTGSRSSGDADDNSVLGADLTLRKTTDTWLKLQGGRTTGLVSNSLFSYDGGFGFTGNDPAAFDGAQASSYRADVSLGIGDVFRNGKGRVTLYTQSQDAGYSAPGLATASDRSYYGGTVDVPIGDRLSVVGKADHREQDAGLTLEAAEINVRYQLDDRWKVAAGVRNDKREDLRTTVPLTQEQGQRTDAVVHVGYDSAGKWNAWGFAQQTLSKDGDRQDNGRVGTGGAMRIGEKLRVEAEASAGDLGPGGRLGTSYMVSDKTSLYLNYALENERGDILNGTNISGQRGSLVGGMKRRLVDGSTLYAEERYQDANEARGLTHAAGMSLNLGERWTLGANAELGTLQDSDTAAETERRAGGVRVAYTLGATQVSSGVEYRADDSEQVDATHVERTTWLLRNNFKVQMSDDWRLVGKFDHSRSESSQGQFYDGKYTEGVVGFGYRPVASNRLNALAKYTYFYNVPTTDQVTLAGTAAQFIQKSHIASVDANYALTPRWSVGGKYAYRLGSVSLDRENPEFFDNRAQLLILRTDLRLFGDYEALVEARRLHLPDIDESRSGMLLGVYRYFGEHVKAGVGYNFTDFSENLTDLSYRHQGVFVNVVGAL
ncbi:OmpA family protein [Lysobacter solisilvae (ex Woo and Kim 2020)]|uniref:OmpA family protein n=1 Tax=Agrilutibacter terrestris TaxID=2865112 RepID=A0A7H0FU82_9GAMM|nr:OmpA family protein [Lysobacter terrestris]QNP39598.1 OmpA family protein [Lysobacter terrestris]